MAKLYTEVIVEKAESRLSLKDRIMVLGSCFSENIGQKLEEAGFNVQINPFGTLYNPESISNAIHRLESGEPFGVQECVQMGAGAGKICSFSHHTSFARETAEEFLDNTNKALAKSSDFWKQCNKVIITLGTALVWRRQGTVVANCLKRPGTEFIHEELGLDRISGLIAEITEQNPEKEFIFTVSPIRHLGEGAHSNTLSKALLQLGLCEAISKAPNAVYFPSYEIVLDELRDYRFYAEDLVHPSKTAIEIIWERFLDTQVQVSDLEQIRENEKASRRARHRNLFNPEAD